MEQEICQKQKNLTNIHEIYNSNKPKTSEIEVSDNDLYFVTKNTSFHKTVCLKIGRLNQYQ